MQLGDLRCFISKLKKNKKRGGGEETSEPSWEMVQWEERRRGISKAEGPQHFGFGLDEDNSRPLPSPPGENIAWCVRLFRVFGGEETVPGMGELLGWKGESSSPGICGVGDGAFGSGRWASPPGRGPSARGCPPPSAAPLPALSSILAFSGRPPLCCGEGF